MPLVTRYFIKSALFFFVAALFCGLLLALRPFIQKCKPLPQVVD